MNAPCGMAMPGKRRPTSWTSEPSTTSSRSLLSAVTAPVFICSASSLLVAMRTSTVTA